MNKLLFILVVIFSCNNSMSYAQTDANTYIEITLGPDKREISVNKGNKPITRGVVPQPACAYLYNNVVNLNFYNVFSTATITIINEMSGEVIYTEMHNNPIGLKTNLSGESSGDYLIEIEADETYLVGRFSL